VGITANWLGDTGDYCTFRDGDNVQFGDFLDPTATVNVGTVVEPGSVVVDNSMTDYEFTGAGSIAGPTGLVKRGDARLTLANTNTYTGDTEIQAGTLVVAAAGALGAGAVRLGAATGSDNASLLVSGALVVDRHVTVQSDGSGASTRTLGGTNTEGTAVFSGGVTLNDDLTLTAAPGGTVSLTGPLDNLAGKTITKIGDGAVTLTGPQTHGAGAALAVSGGTVNLNSDAGSSSIFNLALSATSASTANLGATQHLAGLALAGGAKANLVAGHDKVLVTKALGIEEVGGAPTSRLDLADNAMIVDYDDPAASPLQDIKRWIASGYSGKQWDASGIVSTTAAGNPLTVGLGYAQNDLLFPKDRYSIFAGQAVDLTTVLVKYTYLGDVNLDGKVDDNDVTILVLNYDRGSVSTHAWAEGDVAGCDGKIDDNDVTALVLNYGAGWKAGMGGPLGGISAAVPEPATLALLALGAAALRLRKAGRRAPGTHRVVWPRSSGRTWAPAPEPTSPCGLPPPLGADSFFPRVFSGCYASAAAPHRWAPLPSLRRKILWFQDLRMRSGQREMRLLDSWLPGLTASLCLTRLPRTSAMP
jgi:autotransporter-associated beta strand protein